MKEGDSTEKLVESLVKELNCETVFTIPVFGGIAVDEGVVVTWIIMAVLTILSIVFVRNLSIEKPGKVQLMLESVIGWAQDFFEGIIGKENKGYIPYLMTVALYLAISNVIGLLGFKPPTKDMNVTIALAVMSMFVIEWSGIHRNGLVHWCKHFAKPVPIVAPIMILEIVIRPLSLCMRLFGNMLGGFVVMELIKEVVPLIVPIPFSFYFDIFDGLLQAYVFVFLTAFFLLTILLIPSPFFHSLLYIYRTSPEAPDFSDIPPTARYYSVPSGIQNYIPSEFRMLMCP